MHRLPILTFHAVETAPSVLAYPPAALREGLARLHRRGWRTIDLHDAVLRLRDGGPWPARSFAVTFDDGYRSVYEQALPALRDLGMSATVFVTTGRRDGGDRPPPLGGREMLSWSELAEMSRHGIAVGAHTLSHPDLTRIGREAARSEMAESRDLIEQRLGVSVRTFAYPFGRFDAASRELASELFDGACSDRLGRAGRHSDRFALPRVEMYYLRTAAGLAMVASPWFGLLLTRYALPRRIRRALIRRRPPAA